MTVDDAISLIGVILAAYPTHAMRLDKDAQKGMRAVWPELLEDIDFAAARAALLVHCRTSKWIPSVAEIREMATTGTSAARAGGDAWGDVIAAVRRYGAHRDPFWADPLVGRAVRGIGGWAQICASENQVADRSQFVALYEKLAAEARREATAGPAMAELRQVAGPQAAQQLASSVALKLSAGRRS